MIVDSDGFILATGKKTFKSSKMKTNKADMIYYRNVGNISVNDTILAIEQEAKRIEKYSETAINIIEKHLNGELSEFVCYGIGSFTNCLSLCQFAFAIEVVKRFQPLKSFIYDPCMDTNDRILSEKYGFEVIKHNEKGYRRVEKQTLFYMPHCPLGLYDRLVEANFKRLDLVHIIGNNFSSYSLRRMPTQLKEEAPFINYLISEDDTLIEHLPHSNNFLLEFGELAYHSFNNVTVDRPIKRLENAVEDEEVI